MKRPSAYVLSLCFIIIIVFAFVFYINLRK